MPTSLEKNRLRVAQKDTGSELHIPFPFLLLYIAFICQKDSGSELSRKTPVQNCFKSSASKLHIPFPYLLLYIAFIFLAVSAVDTAASYTFRYILSSLGSN